MESLAFKNIASQRVFIFKSQFKHKVKQTFFVLGSIGPPFPGVKVSWPLLKVQGSREAGRESESLRREKTSDVSKYYYSAFCFSSLSPLPPPSFLSSVLNWTSVYFQLHPASVMLHLGDVVLSKTTSCLREQVV